MPEPSDRWRAYARLQEKLAGRAQVDDTAWGLEAGLNRMLDQDSPAEVDVQRAVESEGRKERYRARLRRTSPPEPSVDENPERTIEWRRLLHRARAKVTASDWEVLRAIGEGYTYSEVAERAKATVGALRVRVLRLRRSLVA